MKCLVCSKRVGAGAFKCVTCGAWTHPGCGGYTKQEVQTTDCSTLCCNICDRPGESRKHAWHKFEERCATNNKSACYWKKILAHVRAKNLLFKKMRCATLARTLCHWCVTMGWTTRRACCTLIFGTTSPVPFQFLSRLLACVWDLFSTTRTGLAHTLNDHLVIINHTVSQLPTFLYEHGLYSKRHYYVA